MHPSNSNSKYQCSLIIPIYNESNKVRSCLTSIYNLGETVEVILINDGSTDDSEEIILDFIRSHKAYNISYFKQENKGAASARLYGIENASTSYIAFLDCDDSLDTNSLDTAMLKFVENDEIDFVLFDYYYVRCDNKHERFSYSIKSWPVTGLEAFANTIENWGIHAFGVYRKSTILAGYELSNTFKDKSTEVNNVNDDEFIARCAMLNSRFVTLSEGRYLYNSNDESTTRRLNINLFRMVYTTLILGKLITSKNNLHFLKPAFNLYALRVSTNLVIKYFKWRKNLPNYQDWIAAISILVNEISLKKIIFYLGKRPVMLTWSIIKYLCIWIIFGRV